MDFHSLTRKELQTLCKRNKIPANMTNVAMADALKALEIVEGLDEFTNQSQSPEKTMNKSSENVPTTVTRTSTRRKTTRDEPQSTQPTTRTQRMTRRTMELGEENKNVNVPESPVIAATTTTRRRAQKTESEANNEQKKSDQLETPALQSGRRRPGVGSTRRKVEAQKEVSVQQGYTTRRSVRLQDKCMTGLNLKDSARTEPEKIDEMVENKNGQSEAPAEVPLARNLSESLEDERDLEDDVPENSDGNDCTVTSEADSHKSDTLDTKDASPDEKTVESDAYLAKSTTDKLADMSDRTIDPKGSDDVPVSEDSYENDNTDEELAAENNGGYHADETKSIDLSVADAFEKISEDALDHSSSADDEELVTEYIGGSHADETKAIDVLVADAFGGISEEPLDHSSSADEELVAESNGGSHADETKSIDILVADTFEKISEEASDHSSYAELREPVGFVSVEECATNHSPQGIECRKSADKDCDINVVTLNDDLAKPPEAEEYEGGKESHMDSSEKMGSEESDNNSLADELQASCEQESIFIPTATYSSEDPMNMVNEKASVDVNVGEESDNNSLAFEQESIFIPTASYSSEDPTMVNEEALVEVNVAEEIIHAVESSFQNAPKSVVSEIPTHKMLDYVDTEALVDVALNPEVEFEETVQEIPPVEKSPAAAKLTSPCPSLTSNNAIATSIPLSSLTAQFSQPTHFTPRKSSSMKQITIPKVITDNKENIDNNSMKVNESLAVNVAEEIIHAVESSFQNAPKSVASEIPTHKMLDYVDTEALVDVAVNPEVEFEETVQEIPPVEQKSTAQFEVREVNGSPTAQFSLASNNAIATSIPLSSLTTHCTPRKSSSMKQTTIPKVISDNNKENIDNNSMKVEPNLGKVKQNKNIIDEETMQKLESMSLRNLKKLTKMFDKLQITDIKPLGKIRPALQTLPQNCMSTGEAEKQV